MKTVFNKISALLLALVLVLSLAACGGPTGDNVSDTPTGNTLVATTMIDG